MYGLVWQFLSILCKNLEDIFAWIKDAQLVIILVGAIIVIIILAVLLLLADKIDSGIDHILFKSNKRQQDRLAVLWTWAETLSIDFVKCA